MQTCIQQAQSGQRQRQLSPRAKPDDELANAFGTKLACLVHTDSLHFMRYISASRHAPKGLNAS